MSVQEKFAAAVNVIRSLPKKGSYVPSNDMMLRFYGFYKQATEGPCKTDRPGFWDIVNRAKWDAWKTLGDMPCEEAMQSYVNELHKIVETMTYNKTVASFLDTDDEFPSADLELIAGDVLARCRDPQEEDSALVCRDCNVPDNESHPVSFSSSPAHSPSPTRTRHDSEDEFIDTVDDSVNEPEIRMLYAPPLSNGHAHQITSQLTHLKVLEQLPGVLARLEADVGALRKAVEGDRRLLDQVSNSGWRWPWQELSPPTMIFLFVWPFVAFRIASNLQRRNT